MECGTNCFIVFRLVFMDFPFSKFNRNCYSCYSLFLHSNRSLKILEQVISSGLNQSLSSSTEARSSDFQSKECSQHHFRMLLVCKRTLSQAILTKWLSDRLQTKWLWVQIPFLPLKLLVSCLFRAKGSLTFRQLKSVDSL